MKVPDRLHHTGTGQRNQDGEKKRFRFVPVLFMDAASERKKRAAYEAARK
jgi:hypothetical protein